MFFDITDRKLAEQRLAEAHQFLQSSLDALSSHVAVLDEDGVILAVNDAWRRFADENQFTGHAYGVGSDYLRACEPDPGECVEPQMVAGLKGVLAGRLPYFEYEYPCHSATELRWFVMRATRFKRPAPVRVVVAHEDVTKRKLAEDGLKEADRRKDEFLATLAHELRNPLAPIRNAIQVLRLKGPDEPQLRWGRDVIDRQVEHLTRLIDDLMDISRITRNKLELRMQQVGLAEVVNGAVESSRPAVEQCGQELTVTLPPQPIYMNGDLVRLAQVFQNLLTNAAKYTERGGRIWLTAERQGSDVVVRVRDTGVGIPAEKLPQLFEMFFQVDRTLERSQGGLGIGLSLVRRLVELHGGTVEARSEGVGRGSEFIVRLPVLVEQPSPLPSREPGGNGEAKAPARRILVVDDNEDSADSLGQLLELLGHQVHIAYDGVAGVEAAERVRPEVVLMDIGMPKLNGYDACRRIREPAWGRDVVLIAMTGWGQEEDRRRTLEAGFDAHMVKPIDPHTLMGLLVELRVAAG